MVEAGAVKFCAQVGYIMSYQKNKEITPKGAWLRSRDLFKFSVLPIISPGMAKARDVKFGTVFSRWRFSIKITNCPLNGRDHGHVTS